MAADVEAALASNLFVVLDPTRMVQPSLERAAWMAERSGAALHLYCCVYDPLLASIGESQDAAVAATASWLDRLADGLRAKGLQVTTQVESNEEWRDAIARAAAKSSCELVVKTASLHGPVARRLMKTADWTLIRDSSRPILLVNPTKPANPQIVLAAVKQKPVDKVHVRLNERVVELSHRIAAFLGAELHAVTVYKGDDMFFDRQQFANGCRLPRNRVHAVEGVVHRGIAEVAEKIGAGVIIVGMAGRKDGAKPTEAARYVADEVRTADVIVLPAA
jgi:nucleotide-binding universal stress UspA family protein